MASFEQREVYSYVLIIKKYGNFTGFLNWLAYVLGFVACVGICVLKKKKKIEMTPPIRINTLLHFQN